MRAIVALAALCAAVGCGDRELAVIEAVIHDRWPTLPAQCARRVHVVLRWQPAPEVCP